MKYIYLKTSLRSLTRRFSDLTETYLYTSQRIIVSPTCIVSLQLGVGYNSFCRDQSGVQTKNDIY